MSQPRENCGFLFFSLYSVHFVHLSRFFGLNFESKFRDACGLLLGYPGGHIRRSRDMIYRITGPQREQYTSPFIMVIAAIATHGRHSAKVERG